MVAPFVDDAFAGAPDGPLEDGGAWSGAGFALAAGRAYPVAAGVAVAGVAPVCPDYTVTARVASLSTSSGRTSVGVLGRWDGLAGYEARYSAANLVQLWRHGAGGPSLLAQVSVTPPLVGAPAVPLVLRLAGPSVEAWWDGARVARVHDDAVRGPGLVGLRALAAGAAAAGQQVESFEAAEFERAAAPRHHAHQGARRVRGGRRR